MAHSEEIIEDTPDTVKILVKYWNGETFLVTRDKATGKETTEEYPLE